MKSIKYSDTGQFTDTQCKLCREIAVRLKKLQKLKIVVPDGLKDVYEEVSKLGKK